MGKDFYAILGVPKGTSDEKALRSAYKKAALKWHPDRHASKSEKEQADAAEKFKDVAEAFEVLSDADKRAVYERYGEEGLKAGGPAPSRGGRGMPAGFSFGGGMPGNVQFSFSSQTSWRHGRGPCRQDV